MALSAPEAKSTPPQGSQCYAVPCLCVCYPALRNRGMFADTVSTTNFSRQSRGNVSLNVNERVAEGNCSGDTGRVRDKEHDDKTVRTRMSLMVRPVSRPACDATSAICRGFSRLGWANDASPASACPARARRKWIPLTAGRAATTDQSDASEQGNKPSWCQTRSTPPDLTCIHCPLSTTPTPPITFRQHPSLGLITQLLVFDPEVQMTFDGLAPGQDPRPRSHAAPQNGNPAPQSAAVGQQAQFNPLQMFGFHQLNSATLNHLLSHLPSASSSGTSTPPVGANVPPGLAAAAAAAAAAAGAPGSAGPTPFTRPTALPPVAAVPIQHGSPLSRSDSDPPNGAAAANNAPSSGRAPSHRSRNGCYTCRRRKVKCDERTPVCIKCEYSDRKVSNRGSSCSARV